MTATREQRLERALFRGSGLTLENPDYLRAVRTLTEALLHVDLTPRDLTVEALGVKSEPASAIIVAREDGVAAGLDEWSFMFRGWGVEVTLEMKDGDRFERGRTVLRAEGERTKLLSLERVGLNLLQRMSGIATTTRCLERRGAGPPAPRRS